jgi:hypothetical protein
MSSSSNSNSNKSSSSSSSSRIMVVPNEFDDLDIVLDIDVEKDSAPKDHADDGSMLSRPAGDPKESASKKQEEGAVDKVKANYKEEEMVKSKPRSIAKSVAGVPPVAGLSGIYSLSSAKSLSSVRPGAYRVGPHTEDDDEEDEVTRSSSVAQSTVLPDGQQPYLGAELHRVQGIDLEALVDEEASRVLQKEHEQQPVVEAVAQGDDEGKFVPSGQENDDHKVCGLPKWCIEWFFLGTMMVLLVYLVGRPHPPTTMAPTVTDPINNMFDLLRDYVPDIPSSQPNSIEYLAVEWLARNNFTSSLAQGYAMVVLYLETGGDTGNWSNTSLWLSEEPICDWYGVGCNGTDITTLNLGK